MNLELFAPATVGPESAAGSPWDDMGAYEALMAGGSTLRSLAQGLHRHSGLRLPDLVSQAVAVAAADRTLLAIRAAGIVDPDVIVPGSGDYPQRLREAPDIVLLYTLGSRDLFATRCVALVGTRRPGAAGLRRTAQWGRALAAEGFTIVSGLARGIDTCAHQAAMETGGRTIAVLGTPLSVVYPPENRALQSRIAAQHLLISHVPFLRHAMQGDRDNREFFLQRNAVIAALSEAMIVTEAGETSGALAAARHALRQGRRVLIPQDCCRDASQRWPADLLAQGAVAVRDYKDIREQLDAGPRLNSVARPAAPS
jgi:DNA processing protein